MGPLQGTHVEAGGGIREIPVLVDSEGNILSRDTVGLQRLSVTPELSTGPARKIIKNTNAASSTIIGFRYTIAPGDDIAAGRRLAEQLEDTWLLSPGDTVQHAVLTDDAFDIYVACVANVAYANAAGTILPTGTTESATRTAMTKFPFPAGTKFIELTCHDAYQISSVTYGLLSVGGGKDA